MKLFCWHGGLFKQTLKLTLLFSVTVMFASCTNSDRQNVPESKAETTSSASPTATQTLRIAAVPWQSPEEQQKKLQPLSDYLQQTMGRPVSFQITKDYAAAVDLLVKEEVDMAYLGALTYVKARERNPHVEPLVLPIDQSTKRPWYTAVIVANTSKGIKSLSDLKGKRFAFVSPSSTSGFLMPMAELQKQGIDPNQDFRVIRYSGSHDKAEKDMLANRVDAIADDKPSFTRSQQSGTLPPTQYKIIWESEPIPSAPIVINTKNFAPKTITQLRQALIDAPLGVVDVSGNKSAGYTLAKDADFEQIRQIYKRLESITVVAKP